MNAIEGDTSIYHVNNIMVNIPDNVIAHFGEDRIKGVLVDYQSLILEQKVYYDQQVPIPKSYLSKEEPVIQAFQQLTKEFKSEFWMEYHLISPLMVFKELSFHSNLSLRMFQVEYRGNVFVEFLRGYFFLLHILCFIGPFINLFIRQKLVYKFMFAIAPLIYIFYLCYFQRGVEERYTLPLLPVLLIGLFNIVHHIYKTISQKRSIS